MTDASVDDTDTPDGWSVIESVTEYDTPWYTGGYDLVEQPDGSTKRYYWAELPAAVVVVAVVDDHVLFVEQYRPVVHETHLELPAGIVESGESFTTAARRELREETGFVPDSTALLADFWTCTGVLRHRRGIVFADGLAPGERNLDGNEFLTPRAVPVDEALDVARRAPANDATIEGLLLAREDGFL
ncbi:MAG: NUDIX hydrolase [Haloplanus sp.]